MIDSYLKEALIMLHVFQKNYEKSKEDGSEYGNGYNKAMENTIIPVAKFLKGGTAPEENEVKIFFIENEKKLLEQKNSLLYYDIKEKSTEYSDGAFSALKELTAGFKATISNFDAVDIVKQTHKKAKTKKQGIK